MIFLEVPAQATQFPKIVVDRELHADVDSAGASWRLFGVIYLGFAHFTARFIDECGNVWYHDGISTGESCVLEPLDVDLAVAHDRKAAVFMYSRI